MDVFRRLTNPTLKKLYRFVLKRLVGRFLNDDIALEQLDVQLRAGRVELTDLTINVSALAELLPDASFRLVRARVGRLRVEISYSKLLTDSLAFYVDDVVIEIAPSREGASDTRPQDKHENIVGLQRQVGGVESSEERGTTGQDAAGKAALKRSGNGGVLAEKVQIADAGEGLDFLAQWIEQITSKVKVVVNNLELRVASAAQLEEGACCSHDVPYMQILCSSLKWCDETPVPLPVMAERPTRVHGAATGAGFTTGPGKVSGSALLAHKRLTLGPVAAHWSDGVRKGHREIVKMGGSGCILIKQDRRPRSGPTTKEPVLDIDVSLRHVDITFGVAECIGLCALLDAYLPRKEQLLVDVVENNSTVVDTLVKPLFREDFWYFDGLPAAGDSVSGELNFDTLSDLLEKYADARARLSAAGGYGRGAFGDSSHMSLGQSDIFFDCEEGSDYDIGGGGETRAKENGAEVEKRDSVKARVRITGLDVTLILGDESVHRPGAGGNVSCISLQARRISQTLDFMGTSMLSISEIGTFVIDFDNGSLALGGRARVVDMMGPANATPCVRIRCSTQIGAGSSPNGNDADGVMVDVQCPPVAVILDKQLVTRLAEFATKVQARRKISIDDEDDGGDESDRSAGTTRRGEGRDSSVAMTVAVPNLTLRVQAERNACSSDAHTALIRSVQNGTSAVGWASQGSTGSEAPALVLEMEGVVVKTNTAHGSGPEAALECSRVTCEMILACSGTVGGAGESNVFGLCFMEASRSVDGTPLKAEYGPLQQMRKGQKLGVARSANADLNFLHTWEPSDGTDSSAGEVSPGASFGGRQDDKEGTVRTRKSSVQALLCDLPRLAVELSRLELVVLADILAGLSPPPDLAAAVNASSVGRDQVGTSLSTTLEVLVEVRGATIVLHEATEFAEDPGPHSFVLNLGSASLYLGGSDKAVEGPAPLVTVSSGDVCVYESLRQPRDRSDSRREGVITGPLLFPPERGVTTYPSPEDLELLDFVPVLYQTKWAKGTSPIAAELTLAVSGPGAGCKTITATLNLFDVSLRYTVTSSWLPRLLGLLVGDVPAGRGVSANTSETGVGVNARLNVEPGGSLTKMFITVFNGVVDYIPQAQGAGPIPVAGRDSEGAERLPNGASRSTEGRAVFPIGVLRVSSNMVAGALMQGFKVVIRDIGLHMSHHAMDYSSEDYGLCHGALGLQVERGQPPEDDLSSVQEYLEKSYFVQIATLNFLDAFLRTRSQVFAPPDAFTAVELWMGILHVYTCPDSLSTCQALLGEWWALVNECRTATGDPGDANTRLTKHDSGKALRGAPDATTSSSLLDDVEQDAFLPGNITRSDRASSPGAETKSRSVEAHRMGGEQHPGVEPRNQESLVIEDYYCVSVDAPETDVVAPTSIFVDGPEGERRVGTGSSDVGTPGQGSSFISESEGPAQWLAAPNVSLDHPEILSMESAEETSESEGEEDLRASATATGVPAQPAGVRLSTFGFSLPAPIEIELEDRGDAESPEGKKSGNLRGSISPETASSPEAREIHRSGTESTQLDEKDSPLAMDLSPRAANAKQGVTVQTMPISSTERTPSDGNAPLAPQPLFERDSTSSPEPESSSAYAENVTGEDLSSSAHSNPSSERGGPKVGPVHGEQEARWLGKGRTVALEGSEIDDARTGDPHDEPEDFRVYPHYIPIPSSAEASSLPFLSGDPLQALGHGLRRTADGGAEVEGPEPIDQKLQFQLAIHDLSVCWRLFKGQDWSEEGASNPHRTLQRRGGESRRRSTKVARDVASRAAGKGRGVRLENTHEDSEDSSHTATGLKPRKTELLDALLENYQDEGSRRSENHSTRRATRQPKVKLLKTPGDSGFTRSEKHTGRDTSCMLEVVLGNSNLRLDSFHPGPPSSLLSNLLFSVKDLQASDTLTSSRPRKTIQHWRDDVRHPREFQQKMVTVRMTARSPSDHFCPEDAPLGDEIMLKIRLLPVHLSFGQHTVDFLRSFSQEAQGVDDIPEQATGSDHATLAGKERDSPFFISCCDVGACKVKIDYQPRAIKVGALQQGDYVELLNLFPLEGVHLTMRKLVLAGVSGWNGVTQLLLQSWVQDITSNQLHRFLAGTTAVRPLVTVGKGVADLVLLPVQQYRRDGRVLRGLRKGTQSFLRAITIETLHTSHRVASFVARTLDDIVTQPGSRASLRGSEYYDEQPTGVLESLEHAYDALAKEVQVAAQTIIAIPYEEQEEIVGPHGRSYVRSVARALPVAVLRPVVGASEALSCTLLGFRNYMSPVIRREEEGKWR